MDSVSAPASSGEFTNAPVPEDRRIAWWTIALIKIGIVLALPGFLIGAQIGNSMGLRDGAIAFFAGATILALIAALTGTVGARTHLPTSVITQFPFGRVGARAVNLILATTLVGWFAVTAELFGDTLAEMATTMFSVAISNELCIAVGGFLMILTTMFGFRAISRLADISVPLLLILLLVVTWLAVKDHTLAGLLAYEGNNGPSLGLGISAVVGGPAVGTIIFPDIARFARSPNHGRVAAIATYAICLPLMFTMVAIASVATGESSIIKLMVALGLGGITLAFVIVKAWTTNVGNLYSSTLFVSSIAARASFRTLVCAMGAIGVAAAMCDLTRQLVPFLVVLGVTIPPIAGIYVTDFYLRGGRLNVDELRAGKAIGIPAFLAWAAGIGVAALATRAGLTLTGIPACDSILTAAAAYFVIRSVLMRRHPA